MADKPLCDDVDDEDERTLHVIEVFYSEGILTLCVFSEFEVKCVKL